MYIRPPRPVCTRRNVQATRILSTHSEHQPECARESKPYIPSESIFEDALAESNTFYCGGDLLELTRRQLFEEVSPR